MSDEPHWRTLWSTPMCLVRKYSSEALEGSLAAADSFNPESSCDSLIPFLGMYYSLTTYILLVKAQCGLEVIRSRQRCHCWWGWYVREIPFPPLREEWVSIREPTVLDLLASRSLGINFTCLQPPSLCGCVIAAQETKKVFQETWKHLAT